jgi:hypothetical protein
MTSKHFYFQKSNVCSFCPSIFDLKNRPGRISFSYADLLAFLFSVDKSIGSGCFFPDLDPYVNLIDHAAITEMIMNDMNV